MSNILLVIKDGILSEIRSDGLDDRFIIADYDAEPDLDLGDAKVFPANRRLTEEEINIFNDH